MTEPAPSGSTTTDAGFRWTLMVVVMVTGFVACFVRLGADCLWLVAIGDYIRERGSLPEGVPFAAAPSEDWPNILVAAELVLSAINDLGPAGLPLFQVAMSATALVLVAVAARSDGASDAATARILPLVAVGALPALVIVRLQVFSLVPFAILLWLLRAQFRRPTRAIWWLPALVAVWTNLHGAVLLGVAVAGAYLLFSRLRARPLETVLVGLATLVALLATPEGWRTALYYIGVMDNEAADQASGLWARPSLGNPFDVVMIVVLVVLVLLAVRRRLPVWEYVVLVGLAVATASAARHGLWLLLWAAAPAAVATSRHPVAAPRRSLLVPAVLVSTIALAALVVVPRGHDVLPEDPDIVRALAREAGNRVVLAPEPLAESLAVEGTRLWVADPIDAFGRSEQLAFLAFVDHGEVEDALPHVDVAIVEDGSDQADAMTAARGFALQATHGDWLVYTRAGR